MVRPQTIQRLTHKSQDFINTAFQHWQTAYSLVDELHENVLPRQESQISNTPDGPYQESLAEGFKTWVETLKNKITASHAEIEKPHEYTSFGFGKISVEMGYDTKKHADATIYSPFVTMAQEAKEINTTSAADVDAQIRGALGQLVKRDTSASHSTINTWVAQIEVRNPDNPYPYTPMTIPLTKPWPLELATAAKTRNYKGGVALDRSIIIKINTQRFGKFEFHA